MTRPAEDVLKEVLTLSAEDHAAVAGSLIASLDDVADEDAAMLWSAEIARRIAEADAGAVQPIPWSEVRQRPTSLAG